MFKRFVKAIRRKPKAVRDQYAFWIAISFTGVVVLFWLGTLSFDFRLDSVQDESNVTQEAPESLSDMMGELREEIGNLSQATQSSSTTNPTVATTTASTSTSLNPATTTQVISNPIAAPEVRIATFTAPAASTTP